MKTLAIFGATGQTGLHLVAQALLKGGVISEGKYFQFYPSSKNQTSQPKLSLIFLFRFKMRGTMIWFDFFGEWDQIEHTFLYYSTFNTDLRCLWQIIGGGKNTYFSKFSFICT